MRNYKEFKNRRDRLATKIAGNVAIVANSKESIRNKDCHYPFRSDSTFHYLSGFPEPETVVMIFGGKNTLLLFKNLGISLCASVNG